MVKHTKLNLHTSSYPIFNTYLYYFVVKFIEKILSLKFHNIVDLMNGSGYNEDT